MSIETNLHGRLRNTPLSKAHALLPMYEAVINSIHSIEESPNANMGKITVDILRKQQANFNFKSGKKPGPDAHENISGFSISDNGVGFNSDNMKSFEMLDSEYKIKKGGRGIGRLLWLKAFRNVSVQSAYKDEEGKLQSRHFRFTAAAGVSDVVEKELTSAESIQTKVLLEGFEKEYQEAALKTVGAIADSLFEHCLWYFVRPGGAPDIILIDGDQVVSLQQVFEQHMKTSAVPETFTIKNKIFDLIHVRLRAAGTKPHVIAFCADNRLVKDENITGKIPGLHSKIKDATGEFIYACYVSSQFLDTNVRAERTDFNISDNVEDLYADEDLSFNEIKEAVIAKASEHLKDYLKENVERSKVRLEKFVTEKAPRYRPIMAHIEASGLNIDAGISDKDLELTLHKILADVEGRLLSDGHDLMQPMADENLEDYQERLNKYLSTVEEIKKSDLANYVFHRRVILDILRKAIQKGPDGKYSREDLIHSLIMPMGEDSGSAKFKSLNLWLVDERLAFHDYLASDKTLISMPITSSASTKEPDLLALNTYDNPVLVNDRIEMPLASITVVEIKRPMRDDAAEGEEKDPIAQALGYLERIREGKVQTPGGRPIPNSQDIPGFCYIIADLTATMVKRCKNHNLRVTSDFMGYFGYNDNYKAYIEVISFDRLVNSAEQRNKAFFVKLGLPTI